MQHGRPLQLLVWGILLSAPTFTNFLVGLPCARRRTGVQRAALVSQTVEPRTELNPKSHLTGALQRALGRNEVYKSEVLFFHRTTERQDRFYALLRIPALPKKKADGTNYIPVQPFGYFEGEGKTLEDSENDAAAKALVEIRKADTEITRWHSWVATTSQQALELAADEIGQSRLTDGESRKWMSRALQKFHGRRIKKFETPYYQREDFYSGAFHVVLAVPWKAKNRRALKYYFEGTGLDPLLAKESAAEAAFKILSPISRVRRKEGPDELMKPLREVVSNEKVPAKIRLHQLLDHIFRKTGRQFNRRRDLIYSTEPWIPDAKAHPFKVYKSNVTQVSLRLPPLEPDSTPLTFRVRVPSWRRAFKEEGEDRRFSHVRKKYWDQKEQERKKYLAAQEAVAEKALKELLESQLEIFEEQERDLERRLKLREESRTRSALPEDAQSGSASERAGEAPALSEVRLETEDA